jgi:hypothetical protein
VIERRYLVDNLAGLTIHPDGAHASRALLSLRFADRDAPDAGERYTAPQLLARLVALDTSKTLRLALAGARLAAEWDGALAQAIRGAGFRVHAAIDGTTALAAPVDWLTLVPRAEIAPATALPVDEVMIVVDAHTTEAALDAHAARWRCEHYFVRPADPTHLARSVALIHARPRWRLTTPLAVPGR